MENLKSYLDGELDLAQKTEVETHLRNDAELQKMVEEFSAISATLKTADGGEAYGLDKLEEKLAAGSSASIYEKKKIWRTAINWSAGSACLVILAMIMFPMMGSSSRADSASDGYVFKSGAGRAGDGDATASATPPASTSSEMKKKSSEMQDRAKVSSPRAPMGGAGGEKGMEFRSPDGAPNQGMSADETPSSDSNKIDAPENGTVQQNTAPGTNGAGIMPSSELRNTRGRTRSDAEGKSVVVHGEPETAFKSKMRQERDKSADPVTSIGDTPHGIYLERAGQVQVKVEDLMRSVNEATGMVQGLDGFVTASDMQNQVDGGTATMTLRVPTKNFNTAIDKLQAMGEVLSVNSNSQDITSETVDNSTRMISWADQEKELVDKLNKAKSNDEKWRLQRRIQEVRVELNAYRAQVKSLTERAKYSTINCTFLRGDKALKAGAGNSGWSGDALRGAKDNLSSVGQVVGTFGIYFLVFSPIWIPFAIAAFVIRRKTK